MAASEKEIKRRLAEIASGMKEDGFDALIIFSQVQTGYAGAVRYISNYHLTTRKEYLVLPLSGDPVLIVPTLGQQFNAKRHSWIKDVREGGESQGMVREVVKVLKASRLETGTLGVVGLSNTLPSQDYQILTQEIPKARIKDGTALFDKVRRVKSQEEIAMIQETTDIADACYEKLLEVLRVGVNERDAMAEVQHLLAKRGVEDILILTAKGPSFPGFIDHPGSYTFKKGDHYIFSVEISGPSGYWSQIIRLLYFEKTTPQYERIFKAAKAAMEAGVAHLIPGKRIGELATAVAAEIQKAGFKPGLWCGHSMGMDVGEAPGLFPDSPIELKEGMIITIHPHVISQDGKEGLLPGDTFVVQKGGARNLSRTACELRKIS
jgi:Xaa-Pro dipeptidase